MINTTFYISDPSNSPPDSLYGRAVARTEPPYQLLGQFLTSELYSVESPGFIELQTALERLLTVQSGEYLGGTEGFDIRATPNRVSLQSVYIDPPASCQLPTPDVLDVLRKWRLFLTQADSR
jgi:hypothetical protein